MHAYMSGPELFISEETDTFNQFESIPVGTKHYGPSIYHPTPFTLAYRFAGEEQRYGVDPSSDG